MFSPLCSCAASQLARPESSLTSRCSPSWISRRSNVLNVNITLSGCRCGEVRSPGRSRYSRTRTRSFSKTTLYLSGSVSVGSAATTAEPTYFVRAPHAGLALQPGRSGLSTRRGAAGFCLRLSHESMAAPEPRSPTHVRASQGLLAPRRGRSGRGETALPVTAGTYATASRAGDSETAPPARYRFRVDPGLDLSRWHRP